MEAYQQRMIEEKQQLDERLAKLEAFINSDGYFRTVTDLEERHRLGRQCTAMTIYSKVLGERIAAFKPATEATK